MLPRRALLLLAAVAAVAALLAGCGGDDGDGLPAAPVPQDDSGVAAGGASGDDPGGAAAPGAGAGNGGSGGAASGGQAPPSGEAVDDLSPLGPPGSYAPAYLRPAPADRVVVEVLVESRGLDDGTLDHLVSVLGRESGKPVEVRTGSVPGDGGPWTADELRAAADRHGTAGQGDGRAVMRLLVVRGGLAGNDEALGAAVRGDVAAVFVEKVRAAGSPLTGSERLERAVVLHEAGHLLGLVDLYLDTGREDARHPGHSPNRASVMYWAVESSLVGEILGGGPSTEFDEADRADLRRIREGA